MRTIAIDVPGVCKFVCLFVTRLHCAKTADWTEVLGGLFMAQ